MTSTQLKILSLQGHIHEQELQRKAALLAPLTLLEIASYPVAYLQLLLMRFFK